MEKVSRAAGNGDSLIISLDPFWSGKLKMIIRSVHNGVNAGFRLWIICPEYFRELVPVDLLGILTVRFHERANGPK